MAELLIALNPAEGSRLAYLLRIPQPGGDLVFRTSRASIDATLVGYTVQAFRDLLGPTGR